MARRRAGRRRDARDEVGQGLLIEGVDEDGLDGVVAILADRVGAGTGGVEAERAVALGEAQDALGAAEAIERAITEQGVDELGAGSPDLSGLRPTPGRRLHEEVDFVGRQVSRQRAALPGPGGAMGRDQGVVVEELDLTEGGADPEALAEQAVGGRVVGAGEDDVTVGVQLGPLPLDQLPRREGQGPEGRPLARREDLQRGALGRAVDPTPGGLDSPAQQVAIAVVHVAEGAAREGVALDVVDPALFHLALVRGRPRTTRRDEETIVLGALPDMWCTTYRRLCCGPPYVAAPTRGPGTHAVSPR
jgi:hypothetical protein